MNTRNKRLQLEVESLEARDQPSSFSSYLPQWLSPPASRATRVVAGTLGRFSLNTPVAVSMNFRMQANEVLVVSKGLLPGQVVGRVTRATGLNGNLKFTNDCGQRIEVRIAAIGSTKPLYISLVDNNQTLIWEPPSKSSQVLVTIIVNPKFQA